MRETDELYDEMEMKIKKVVGADRYNRMRMQGLQYKAKLEEAFVILYAKHYAESNRKKARAIYIKDGRHCMKCGARKSTIQLHHIIPLSKGGTNEEDNIAFLCGDCHRAFHKAYGYSCGHDEFDEYLSRNEDE